MNRRNFLKYSAMFGISNTVICNNSFSQDYSLTKILSDSPLAGSLYYTAEKPGRWEKKVDGHLPIIEKIGNKIEVTTGHEMRGYEHYIVKHVIFDENFNLLSEKMFDPSKDTPISSHKIGGLKNIVFALSLCNKHDAWVNAIKV